MKKLVIFTISLAIFIGYVVFMTTRNDSKYLESSSSLFDSKLCSDLPSRSELLLESKNKVIRYIGELESSCKSHVTSYGIINANIPNSIENAKIQSSNSAEEIFEFDKYDMKPYVIIDIPATWTQQDIQALAEGNFDNYIEEYFNNLANLGVSEDMLLGFIFIKEPNLPNWENKNISGAQFQTIYANMRTISSAYFPSTPTGIYLSASTYEETPINYNDLDLRPLESYTSGLQGNAETLILSGYPWIGKTGSESNVLFDANEYLPVSFIRETVDYLNPQDLVIYTGTFAAKYTSDEETIVKIPVETRKKTLDSLVDLINSLKFPNTKVHVVLNTSKPTNSDDTDWSYFGTPYTENSAHKDLLLYFLGLMHDKGIQVVFDF